MKFVQDGGNKIDISKLSFIEFLLILQGSLQNSLVNALKHFSTPENRFYETAEFVEDFEPLETLNVDRDPFSNHWKIQEIFLEILYDLLWIGKLLTYEKFE